MNKPLVSYGAVVFALICSVVSWAVYFGMLSSTSTQQGLPWSTWYGVASPQTFFQTINTGAGISGGFSAGVSLTVVSTFCCLVTIISYMLLPPTDVKKEAAH
jgi:hypothetical protein